MYKGQQKLAICLLISLLVTGCGPGLPTGSSITPSPTTSHLLNTPTQLQRTKDTTATAGDCRSPQAWTLEFQRDGGIRGVSQLLKMTSAGSVVAEDLRQGGSFTKTLDPTQIAEVTKLLVQACPFETQKVAKICADCFVYSMSIGMDEEQYRVQVNEMSLPKNMQPLIQTLNRLFQQMIAP